MTTYHEIMSEIMNLQEQAKAAWKDERPVALERAKALVNEFQLTAKELFPEAKRYIVPVKYRDGKNTWTGRGKMPKWLKAEIESGELLEDFRV